MDKNNRYYTADGGVLFNKDKTMLVSYLSSCSDTEYTVPDSVSKIFDYAFAGNEFLNKVNMSDKVTEIGNGAFKCCYELKEACTGGAETIPENAFNMGKQANFYIIYSETIAPKICVYCKISTPALSHIFSRTIFTHSGADCNII